jgi:hypothetical protein
VIASLSPVSACTRTGLSFPKTISTADSSSAVLIRSATAVSARSNSGSAISRTTS